MGKHRLSPSALLGATHLWLLLLLLLLMLSVETVVAQNRNSELHVVALVGQAGATARHFLHSSCRLGFRSEKVVGSWDKCTRDGCDALDQMTYYLRTLPYDDLVIVASLGNEYVYIVGNYEDTWRKVAEADGLLVAVQDGGQGESGTLRNQQGQNTHKTFKERLEEKHSDGMREQDDQDELENDREETQSTSHAGKTKDEDNLKFSNERIGKESRENVATSQDEAGANMINYRRHPSRKDDREKEEGADGRAESGTRRYVRREGQHSVEDEMQEEEDKENTNMVLLYRALQEGTVLGRVGTLLDALREGASPSITQDTRGTHVVFGNQRSRGTLRIELPLKVMFYPDDDSNTVPREREDGSQKELEEELEYTEPFIVYSKHEEIDLHNLLEVAGTPELREEDTCSYLLPQSPTEDSPRLLVNLLLGESWAPFLEEVLAGIDLQDYPREALDVWIYSQSGVQEAEISAFMKKNKEKYSSLTLALDQTPDHHLLRSRCDEANCSLLVLMEAHAVLDCPATLRLLADSDRPVVGPVLKQRQEGGETNFVVKKGEDISHWDNLIRSQRVRATLRVAEVQALRVVHRDYLEDLMLGRQVDQYINTRVRPGLLLDPRGHKEGKLHPDLWGLTYNPRAWRQRYIHPDLLSIIWGKAKAEEVGKDLYYVPLFKERFCRELVEELEHFGQWQHKDMDDREEAHHYTSTNINLSQIDYEAEYHVVINTLHKELLATLYGGYRAEGKSSLLFVLRYNAATDYNTFTYHLDGATYTLNVALNNDFTGGGLEYRLGNKLFEEEKELLLPHNRTGWAVVQPDRPYHLHHGVPLLSGRRYALIAIVDTNDAGSKGGPLW
ncbi:LOW QUALITY PROTEIN: uncharacterized protein LOC123517151 [Portunus trituberculatus]|uniref:LOW QUALITY PROTEIN: uncharacterized protein LOC123517151 n=1 Tax=Portunus trituberculatus TaxID=210409 RepID=UPI001E1CF18C|nr:LOW QUALITY PROTEIN: uncharacterized protein LOC123517151 [Portunus trituberculatus]